MPLVASLIACGPVGAPESGTTSMDDDPAALCVEFGARCEECIGEDRDEHVGGCRSFYAGTEADGADCRALLDAYFSCLTELTCSEFVGALPCPELQSQLVPRCSSLGG